METAYAADFILAYELEMHLGPKNGAEAYYANEVYITSRCKKMIHIYLCEDTVSQGRLYEVLLYTYSIILACS